MSGRDKTATAAAIPCGKPQKRPGCALKVPHCEAESKANHRYSRTSNSLRNKRKPVAENGVPIVTYSRLPRDLDQPEDDAPRDVREAEPWLDGVEVPLVEGKARPRPRVDAAEPERAERRSRARAAPDIRADADDERAAGFTETPVAVVADLYEPKRRRPRLLTYVAAIAFVALLVGFGVLAMTFHAATTVTAEAPTLGKDPESEIADLRKQIDALANSAGPASHETQSKIAELESRLADLEAAKAPSADAAPAADAPPKVRTIPTDGSAPIAAVPPAPRERPAKAEASAAPAAADKPAVMELITPVTAVSKAPFPTAAKAVAPTGKAGNAKNGAPSNDAEFIANIEKALASAPPDPAPAAAAAGEPAGAPVALAPAGALAPADEEPGAAVPVGTPAANALPSDIGPAVHPVRRGTLPADAAPVGPAPITVTPQGGGPAPAAFDQGAFDIRPQPGTPVPPEPIPNAQ
jgi:hypothetical protein